MPIRFIDARGQYGNAAIVLGDLVGALTGGVSEPVLFTGSVNQRLEDLSSDLIGAFRLNSSRTGTIARTLTGVSSSIRLNFTQAAAPYWVGAPSTL